MGTNCYVIESEQKNAIIIDPGAEDEKILAFCEKQGLAIKMLLFTHGHFDHVGGMTPLLEGSSATTAIHALDEELMLSPQTSQSRYFTSFDGYIGKKADLCYQDGDVISLDDISLKVMHTPGHTKGSSLLIGEDVIFTGDTVFASSIGRTDLYGGNPAQMQESLSKIAAIEGDYKLLTGHGDSTRLSYEKVNNPYLGTSYDDIF